jgi:hypothetical protein
LLRRQGHYAEALAEFRTGHELGSKRPDWRYPSADWVRQAEQLAALADRIPAILAGDDQPRDNAERLALAQMCYDTKRHAAAARLFAEAMDSDPKLADDRQAGHRYNAACRAALAAAGMGVDDPAPEEAAKAILRAQALAWLKAELAAWSDILASDEPKAHAAVAPTLRHWKGDPDLAGVRDLDTLAKLSEEDQQAWRTLWADVDTLLKKAQVP